MDVDGVEVVVVEVVFIGESVDDLMRFDLMLVVDFDVVCGVVVVFLMFGVGFLWFLCCVFVWWMVVGFYGFGEWIVCWVE